MKAHTWDEVLAGRLAAMTPAEREQFDLSGDDVDAQIRTAELVYTMRTKAGLSQAELARRVGSKQPYVSAVESGGQVPTIATLMRLAKATGNRLVVAAVPA